MLTTIYNEISFPDLGISLNPTTGIDIGGFSIRWYGVIIAIGLCLAVIYACRRSRKFGLTEDNLLDGVLWVTPFAILCARAYYCIFSWSYYADNPISCLYIWQGGLAIYGGVIGAVIGALIFCKIKKIKPLAALDLMALGFMIGQCIGRWGNFFNREAFGTQTESFLRMGLTDQTGYTIYVHPTFLYESLWNLIGFLLIHFLSKRRKYDGQVMLQYLAWYGAGRAVIEGLRTDSLYIPGTEIRVSQALSLFLCVAALAYLIIFHFAKHDPEKLYVNIVAKRKQEEAELLAALMREEDRLPAEPSETTSEQETAENCDAAETIPEGEETTTKMQTSPEEASVDTETSAEVKTPTEEEPSQQTGETTEETEAEPAASQSKLTLWQRFNTWLRT